MVTKAMEPEQALKRGLSLKWAMVHTRSNVYLGETRDWPDAGHRNEDGFWQELIGARFFNENQEVRIFEAENGLKAVCLEGEPEDGMTVLETRELEPAFGRLITLAHELEVDEDGQAYVQAVRLTRWGRGAT